MIKSKKFVYTSLVTPFMCLTGKHTNQDKSTEICEEEARRPLTRIEAMDWVPAGLDPYQRIGCSATFLRITHGRQEFGDGGGYCGSTDGAERGRIAL